MTRLVCLACVALACLDVSPAAAQAPSTPHDESRLWVVAGSAFVAILGDCPECTEDPNYQHASSFVANIGASLNRRTDLGAEVVWVPSRTQADEQIRTTFVLATVQTRPWVSRGFFLKAGAGMAFVRNWVVDLSGGTGVPPFTSKAFALDIGTGWEWRTRSRLGFQLFGTQHVVALGDLQTTDRHVENVVGNFWLIGGGLVFR